MAALSHYNSRLKREDGSKVNRLRESLEVFQDVCVEPALAGATIVLFLNQADRFEQVSALQRRVQSPF